MPNAPSPSVRRILLKLSGEALMGTQSFGIEPPVLMSAAQKIRDVHVLGVEVAVVIGGGNIFRGMNAADYGMGRVTADHMGMLATVMNALALGEALRQCSIDARIMTAIPMPVIADHFSRRGAISHLEKKRVVLFGAGTGNPFFSTDTAAVLRAREIDADLLIKATKVDGVYDSDPKKNPSAQRFQHITHREYVNKGLRVMDITAITMAMESKVPIVVCNLLHDHNLVRIVSGEHVGTVITGDEQ